MALHYMYAGVPQPPHHNPNASIHLSYPCSLLTSCCPTQLSQWIASSDNAHKDSGYCNFDWPASDVPSNEPVPFVNGTIEVDALVWLYTWDK